MFSITSVKTFFQFPIFIFKQGQNRIKKWFWKKNKQTMEFSSNKFFLGSQSVKRTEMEQSQPETGEEHRISEAPLLTP